VNGWIPGVTRHARKRAAERLGSPLSRETWDAILDGIENKRWPSRPQKKKTPATKPGRIYLVPAERDGVPCILPVVARRNPAVVVTVLPLEYPR
jgi:hypothetical protein